MNANRDSNEHEINAGRIDSGYREYRPSLPLADHLVCLWTARVGGNSSQSERCVVPDGCIDIVLVDGEPPMVVGPWTESFLVRHAPGTTIIGGRWHPGRAPAMLGLPASELLNQAVPLGAVWGDAANARFARIAKERDAAERRAAMEAALLERLAYARPLDEAVSAGIQWIARNPGGRIEQLSQWMGISSRQLQRRFTASVGYGAKMFQSVLRFQRLLHLNDRMSVPASLAQSSVDAGYADQSHMTREVQRFSGSPPTALLRPQSVRCALQLSNLFRTTCDRND